MKNSKNIKIYNSIMDKNSKSLKETLTTYPLNKTKSYILKILKKLDICIKVSKTKIINKIPLEYTNESNFDDIQLIVYSLTKPIIEKNSLYYNEICKYMLLLGYNVLNTFTLNGRTFINFAPNKQNSINIKALEFNQYFYHICPRYVTDKILKNGFIPKSKNSIFNYSPRVHFFYDGLDEDFYKKYCSILDLTNKSKANNHKYDIIKVKIPSNIKFYKDLDSLYGVYTLENIHPKYIVSVEHINNFSN